MALLLPVLPVLALVELVGAPVAELLVSPLLPPPDPVAVVGSDAHPADEATRSDNDTNCLRIGPV